MTKRGGTAWFSHNAHVFVWGRGEKDSQNFYEKSKHGSPHISVLVASEVGGGEWGWFLAKCAGRISGLPKKTVFIGRLSLLESKEGKKKTIYTQQQLL